MPTPLRLLLVEDSPDDALLLVRNLRQGDFDVSYQRVDSPASLKGALGSGSWDVVISDFNMPTFNGLDALGIVREHSRDLLFVFVSGSIGEDVAVSAMRAGAQDYVMKGNLARLAPAIARELREAAERRRLEAQFLQAQKMEAVGQLAGGIAHDFNNLLTVITSYSHLLLEDLPASDPRREEVGQIQSAAQAATTLSRQLLVFSRNEVLKPQIVPLNEVASEAAKLLRRLIGTNIELVLELDADTGHVEAEPSLLEQAVLNLAINARDAMPEGGKLIIETHNHADDPHRVTLVVSDNGMGMTAETQARLFEPFFTTKGAGKGTGLGLAMVYHVVRRFGGELNVYSELGVGTTFKIHLPSRGRVADRATHTMIPPEALRGTEVVFVVEDAAAVRSVAKQVLERYGYTVLEAPNGDTALHLAARHNGPIDLVLTDIVMPGISGRELAEKIRQARPNIKVLFASGYTADSGHHLGVMPEGINLLQKPYTPVALARRVRATLDGVPRS